MINQKKQFSTKICINMENLDLKISTKSIADVILDVNSYERFVPFVRKSYIIERTRTQNSFEADLYFDFFSYRSFVSFTPNFEKILINITSPFVIEGVWLIENNSCNISFELGAKVPYMIWRVVEKQIPSIVDAFINRAKKLIQNK